MIGDTLRMRTGLPELVDQDETPRPKKADVIDDVGPTVPDTICVAVNDGGAKGQRCRGRQYSE
jgi:hypothetical protein